MYVLLKYDLRVLMRGEEGRAGGLGRVRVDGGGGGIVGELLNEHLSASSRTTSNTMHAVTPLPLEAPPASPSPPV